jgi:hypothetical protein
MPPSETVELEAQNKFQSFNLQQGTVVTLQSKPFFLHSIQPQNPNSIQPQNRNAVS